MGYRAGMITGAHVMLFSADADADRRFFAEVLDLDHVDAGGGWLIFRLPPTEAAMHPMGDAPKHELYLMCDDIEGFAHRMGERGVPCTAIQEERWGRLVAITLPGGSELGVYQPLHARPS